MKILYVLGFLPPYVTREIEAMAAAGHRIAVLLPEEKKSSETSDFWNNISRDPQGSSVTISRTLKFVYLTCPAKQLIRSFFRSLRFVKALMKSLRESELRYFIIASNAVRSMDPTCKPDMIHAHFAHDQAHIARIMATIMKVPYSVTTHATDIFVPKCKTRLRRVLADASTVFTVSRYNLNYLTECNLCPENIVVARLGLDTEKLPERKPPSNPPLIICTASGLVSKKGVPVLIQAMRLLHNNGIDCRLTVIGSDPDGTTLQKFRESTADISVDFIGALTSEETLDVVSRASLFVLPCIEADNGDKDGIPVALMEAMGMGLPCISTEISGIPELIENDVSGLLVKPESSTELADAITYLLSDSETASRLGRNGRIRVLTNHSPGNLATIMTNSLQEAVRKMKKQ